MFTIVTFNVLAEAYEYTGSPWDGWQVRSERLVDAALQENPDVLCLQEVDHFDDFFEPALRRRGYVGYFVPKTKNPVKPPLTTEGQAIFILEGRFDVVGNYCWTSVDIRRSKRLLKLWRSGLRPDDYNVSFGSDPKLQMLPQVVLGLVLRPRLQCGSAAPLLVMSMHLKSTVKRAILDQLGESVENLKLHQFDAFVRSARATVGSDVPMLCCGDLNQPMSTGLGSAVSSHGLIDAYAHASSRGHRDPIDFILATEGIGLAVVEYLDLPTPGELCIESSQQRLPNEVFPSDHVPRAARVVVQTRLQLSSQGRPVAFADTNCDRHIGDQEDAISMIDCSAEPDGRYVGFKVGDLLEFVDGVSLHYLHTNNGIAYCREKQVRVVCVGSESYRKGLIQVEAVEACGERRISNDFRSYTKAEFIAFFGAKVGLQAWDAAPAKSGVKGWIDPYAKKFILRPIELSASV